MGVGQAWETDGYMACPDGLPVSREDYDAVVARAERLAVQLKRAEALLSLKEIDKAARLNEENGSFKRSAAVGRFLRELAGASDVSVGLVLEECATLIEENGRLE